MTKNIGTQRRYRERTRSVVVYATMALFLCVTLFSALTFQVTHAAPNLQINYQGKLTGASGVAVADGTYHMKFWLLTSPSAATTTALWSEDRSTAAGDRITVRSGLFSVMLGSSTSLASVDFNQTLYLGVEIGGSGGSPAWDGEMTPRKILGTVPAAFEATKLGGASTTQYLRSDQATTLSTSTTSTLLTITQNGVGDLLNLFDGATEVFSVLDGGNVGVGSSTPYAKLAVQGTAGQTTPLFQVASSTFASYLSVSSTGFGTTTLSGLTIAGSATSTSNVGFNITSGCFAKNDVCITGGGATTFIALTDTDQSGFTANRIIHTNAGGTGLTDTAGFTFDGTILATPSLSVTNATSTNLFATTASSTNLFSSNAYFTTASTTNLTVAGKLFDSAGTPGTAGQILQTSGSLATWVSTSTIGLLGRPEIDTSAELAAILGDETGGGSLVFGTSPTFSGTPVFSGGLISYSVNSTSTISNNSPYAWTLATSTTGMPLFRIDTTLGNESVSLGTAGGDVYIGYVGSTTNLVFEESATIHAQGENMLTFGMAGDRLNFAVNTGFGSSTPSAKLSIHALAGETNTTLFAIASSTANSTTTLLTVSNTGALTLSGGASTTASNGFNITSGCYAQNGVCVGTGAGTVTSLNGISTSSQTFATTSNDGGWGFSTSSSVHTLNIPTANAGNPLGLLPSTDWSVFNNKIGSTSIDTLAELETLQGGINIIASTEIDTEGELETILGSLDLVSITTSDITSANLATALSDETGTAGSVVFSTLPTLAGFISNASSTIGGGTQQSGLTIYGGATTTLAAYFSATTTFATMSQNSVLFAGSGGILSQNNSALNWFNSSNWFGVGTSTPKWLMQLATGTAPQLTLSDGSLSSDHWSFRNAGGVLYIGTSSPSTFATSSVGALTLSSATTTVNFSFIANNGNIVSDYDTGTTTIANLSTGMLSFDINAGMITALDIPLETGQATSTVNSYDFSIGGDPIATVYGLASGAGAVISTSTAFGVGSTTPYARLSVQGYAGQLTPLFQVASSTNTPYLTVASTGFGTTTVTGLTISGSATSTSNVGFNITTGCYAINGTCVASTTSIASLNGLTAATQTFASSSSATDFSIVSSGSAHTFNMPSASASARGLLTTSDWSLFNNKVSSTSIDTSNELLTLLTDETGTGNVVFSASPTFTGTLLYANASGTNSTTTNATTTTEYTSKLGLNSEYFTDLTGSGLINSTNVLTCATANSSTFGCLASADWTTFNNKVSSTSIDTLAELETLQGGINIIASTEIDTEGELETILGSLDLVSITTSDITSANLATALSDETGTAGSVVFSTLPTLAGFISNASSTIGAGTQQGGLTISGGATTTLNAYFASNVGVGTTSPFAKLSIHANNGDAGTTLFAIASSTASATTTLFSISNTGSTTAVNGFNISAGCFAINGICVGGLASTDIDTEAELETLLTDVTDVFTSNSNDITSAELITAVSDETGTGSLVFSASPTFTGTANFASLWATGSSTIGAGTQQGGLTISGGSTTTLNAYFASNVGIGTTSPGTRLAITNTVSDAQVMIAYDATRYSTLQTDSVGDFVLNPQGDDAFLNDDNFWICSGGSCPTGAPSGTGNLIVESRVGIGTSTPAWNLQVAGTRPSVALSDTSAGADLKHWLMSSMAGALYIGTSTDAFATSTVAAVTITNTGKVGIGTTSPTKQFSVSDLLYVGASGATGMGTATSTFKGDILITGKLDVGTIDPVYTISGTKYATYGHSMVGIKEEVVLPVQMTHFNQETGHYEYEVAFPELEKGSDLWLFYQVTDLGEMWQNLVVNLTPGFDGSVFYVKDPVTKRLIVRSSAAGEVSLRLIANRFDFAKWGNLRPDQDGDHKGFEIEEK